MKQDGDPGGDTEVAHRSAPTVTDSSMERREFLKRAGRFLGSLLLAGSLGALSAGCGQQAVSDYTPAPAATSQSTQEEKDASEQSSPTATTSPVDCIFYRDGICSRTGSPCTDCNHRVPR